MTIQPNLPQNFTPRLQNKAQLSSAATSQEAAPRALPADTAEVNFAPPALSRAESLYAATAVAAAELQGTLDPHEPDELIVLTRPGFSLTGDEGSVVKDFAATVLGEFDSPGGLSKSAGGEFLPLKLPEGVSVEGAMAAMAEDDRIEFAVPNHTYGLPGGEVSQGITNDPDVKKLWGLHNEGQTGGKVDAHLDAPEAWQIH